MGTWARKLLNLALMATKKRSSAATGVPETERTKRPSKVRGVRPKAEATTPKPSKSQTASPGPSKAKWGGLEADPHTVAVLELRAFGLRYPEAHTKSPWPGHIDLAVRGKTFAYLSLEGEPLHMSCKLPQSCQTALSLEFTTPTGYGLGKSGWVTATFRPEDTPPVEFLKTWIDESYRAIAPKTLVKRLPAVA